MGIEFFDQRSFVLAIYRDKGFVFVFVGYRINVDFIYPMVAFVFY